MDPLTIGAFLAPTIGGLIGRLFGSGDRKKAQEAADKALKIIEEQGLPPDQTRQVLFDQFSQVGLLTPELEQEIDVGVSQAAQIQEDPELRQAQLRSLGALQERGKAGLTAEDRASLSKIRRDVEADRQARLQGVIQSMAQRGLTGSGAELAASLSAAQQGANLEQESGERVAAEASRRALEAIMGAGELGGKLRSQDFDVASKKASAADELKRFAVQNAINRQQRNIAATNAAREANLQAAQDIANRNVQLSNAEKLRQLQAERQKYLDDLERRKAMAAVQSGRAELAQSRASDTQRIWGSVADTTAKGITGYIADSKPTARFDVKTGEKIVQYDPITGKKLEE